eukprot:TRINITY_DN19165_c0_g4_i1.p1 TRINITY_DN19165_c0_g4~~TRINITY_DN19165_c0_g4_i1.p1  ORF type:complete len:100 (+),score=15.48 TRINITY_DN19165_c0_g4_i1:325-624(+)
MQREPCTLLDVVLRVAAFASGFGEELPRMAPPAPPPRLSSGAHVGGNGMEMQEFVINPDGTQERGSGVEDNLGSDEVPVTELSPQSKDGKGCSCKCNVM